MPRVKPLTRAQAVRQQRMSLADQVERLLAYNKISKTDVANYLGVTAQAVSQQFRTGNITMEVFIAACSLADIAADEVERLVKVKG